MPSLLRRLTGLSFRSEMFIINLLGLENCSKRGYVRLLGLACNSATLYLSKVNSTLDWNPFKWSAQIQRVRELSLSQETFVFNTIVEDNIKAILTWIVIIQTISSNLYTLAYLANVYSVVTWSRPILLLPWILLSVFKNFILEILVIAIGILLAIEERLPILLILEFGIVKTFNLVLAAYTWYTNTRLYLYLKYKEKVQTFRRLMDKPSRASSGSTVLLRMKSKSLTTLLSFETESSSGSLDSVSRIIDDSTLSPAEKTIKLLKLSEKEIAVAKGRTQIQQLEDESSESENIEDIEEIDQVEAESTELLIVNASKRDTILSTSINYHNLMEEVNIKQAEAECTSGSPQMENKSKADRKSGPCGNLKCDDDKQNLDNVGEVAKERPCAKIMKERELTGCPFVSGIGECSKGKERSPVKKFEMENETSPKLQCTQSTNAAKELQSKEGTNCDVSNDTHIKTCRQLNEGSNILPKKSPKYEQSQKKDCCVYDQNTNSKKDSSAILNSSNNKLKGTQDEPDRLRKSPVRKQLISEGDPISMKRKLEEKELLLPCTKKVPKVDAYTCPEAEERQNAVQVSSKTTQTPRKNRMWWTNKEKTRCHQKIASIQAAESTGISRVRSPNVKPRSTYFLQKKSSFALNKSPKVKGNKILNPQSSIDCQMNLKKTSSINKTVSAKSKSVPVTQEESSKPEKVSNIILGSNSQNNSGKNLNQKTKIDNTISSSGNIYPMKLDNVTIREKRAVHSQTDKKSMKINKKLEFKENDGLKKNTSLPLARATQSNEIKVLRAYNELTLNPDKREMEVRKDDSAKEDNRFRTRSSLPDNSTFKKKDPITRHSIACETNKAFHNYHDKENINYPNLTEMHNCTLSTGMDTMNNENKIDNITYNIFASGINYKNHYGNTVSVLFEELDDFLREQHFQIAQGRRPEDKFMNPREMEEICISAISSIKVEGQDSDKKRLERIFGTEDVRTSIPLETSRGSPDMSKAKNLNNFPANVDEKFLNNNYDKNISLSSSVATEDLERKAVAENLEVFPAKSTREDSQINEEDISSNAQQSTVLLNKSNTEDSTSSAHSKSNDDLSVDDLEDMNLSFKSECTLPTEFEGDSSTDTTNIANRTFNISVENETVIEKCLALPNIIEGSKIEISPIAEVLKVKPKDVYGISSQIKCIDPLLNVPLLSPKILTEDRIDATQEINFQKETLKSSLEEFVAIKPNSPIQCVQYNTAIIPSSELATDIPISQQADKGHDLSSESLKQLTIEKRIEEVQDIEKNEDFESHISKSIEETESKEEESLEPIVVNEEKKVEVDSDVLISETAEALDTLEEVDIQGPARQGSWLTILCLFIILAIKFCFQRAYTLVRLPFRGSYHRERSITVEASEIPPNTQKDSCEDISDVLPPDTENSIGTKSSTDSEILSPSIIEDQPSTSEFFSINTVTEEGAGSATVKELFEAQLEPIRKIDCLSINSELSNDVKMPFELDTEDVEKDADKFHITQRHCFQEYRDPAAQLVENESIIQDYVAEILQKSLNFCEMTDTLKTDTSTDGNDKDVENLATKFSSMNVDLCAQDSYDSMYTIGQESSENAVSIGGGSELEEFASDVLADSQSARQVNT